MKYVITFAQVISHTAALLLYLALSSRQRQRTNDTKEKADTEEGTKKPLMEQPQDQVS